MSLGMNMQQLRIKKGWSQREVAGKLGYEPSTYSRYESDDVIPNVITLMDIANLYGVGLDELTGFVPKTDNKPNEVEASLYRLKEMNVANKVEGDAIHFDFYGKKYAVKMNDLPRVIHYADLQYNKMLMDIKGLYSASLAFILNGGDFYAHPKSIKQKSMSDKLKKCLKNFKGKVTPDDVMEWFKLEFHLMDGIERQVMWEKIVYSLIYDNKLTIEEYKADERWHNSPFWKS